MQLLTPPDARRRVAFVVPRWTAPGEHDVQGTLFRCLPVAGALYHAGYEVLFVDQEHDLDRDDRREELRRHLEGVGLVVFWMNELWPSLQTTNTLQLTLLIRGWLPDVRVAAGGAFLSLCEPEMLKVDGPVDYFLRGYGEVSVPALARALERDPTGAAGLDEVPGLVWHAADGFRHNDSPYQPIGEANNEVMYRLLDLAPAIQRRGGIFGNEEPTLVVGTGQGCGKRCGFCYWRTHRPSIVGAESIVRIVEHLRRTYDVRQYHLADLDFFMNLARPRELARLWAERLPDSRWFTLCSPVDALKLETGDWAALQRGGCAKLEFGTETGSPRMIAAIGKRHTADEVVEITRRALDHGIETMHNIIFGFVDETADDRRRSIDLIERLHALDPARVTFAVRMFQPTPGTPMGEAALEHIPDFPRTLDEVLAYRPLYGEGGARMMPWLPARDERYLRKLVTYLVPMATSNVAVPGAPWRWAYRALRGLAWWRLRAQTGAFNLDEHLCRRLLEARVFGHTYRP